MRCVSVTSLHSDLLLMTLLCVWESNLGWQGVCGVAPDSGQLQEAVASQDMYM